MTRQGKSPQIEAAQANLTGRTETELYAKESEICLLPWFRIPQYHQANDNNIYAEVLVLQTHSGPMLATSVALCPCEPF